MVQTGKGGRRFIIVHNTWKTELLVRLVAVFEPDAKRSVVDEAVTVSGAFGFRSATDIVFVGVREKCTNQSTEYEILFEVMVKRRSFLPRIPLGRSHFCHQEDRVKEYSSWEAT
jgi:hypothetical protein